MKKKGSTKIIILIAVIALILVSAIAFGFSNTRSKPNVINDSKSNVEDNNTISQISSSLAPIKFDHANITYYLNSKQCGPYETTRIKNAFKQIASSAKAVSFTEQNVSSGADITINCSFIDNCYKEKVEYYDEVMYTTEYTCPYPSGITTLEQDSAGNIVHANIEMVGFFDFSENGKSSRPSGFSIGDCGWPMKESKEILKSIMGYAGGYDAEVQPIFSTTWATSNYGVLNPYKNFVGLSTYNPASCKNTTKEIDAWIARDIQKVYSTDDSKSNYASECASFRTTDRMDWCQLNVSVTKKDTSLCEPIADPFIKNGCYQINAKAVNNLGLCNLISDVGIKESCYFQIAHQKKEVAGCGFIENFTEQASCIYNVSLATKNPIICNGITDSKEQDTKDWCFMQSAMRTTNASFCDKVVNQEKTLCNAIVSGNAKNCSDLNLDSSSKDLCLGVQAEASQDISFCKLIADPAYKNSCYTWIAVGHKDVSFCDQISATWDTDAQATKLQKDECYFYVAYEKKDFSICQNLVSESGWYKDACYWYMADILKDSDACNDISDENWKNYCKRAIFPMI